METVTPLPQFSFFPIVRMRCNSTSKTPWWKEVDGEKPDLFTGNFAVVDTEDQNDPNFVYSNLSPGSYMNISTINKFAGEQFEQGAEYEILIKKVKKAPAAEASVDNSSKPPTV